MDGLSRSAEIVALGAATLLWGGGTAARVARDLPIDGTSAAFFLPTGLLFLTWLNHRLRSRVLAWGVFALGVTLAMIVFGAWALADRAAAGVSLVNAGAAALLYVALATAAALQLRVASSKEKTQ